MKCDDGCGRWACKTWDTDRKGHLDPRQRFKALCGICWKLRHATKVVSCLVVQAQPPAPHATSQGQ